MTNAHARFLALGFPLALLVVIALSEPYSRAKPVAASRLVFAYRAWIRVNSVPVQIAAPLAALCAAPRFPNPHQGDAGTKYGTIWVNPVGRQAMLSEKTPHFPSEQSSSRKNCPMPTVPRRNC